MRVKNGFVNYCLFYGKQSSSTLQVKLLSQIAGKACLTLQGIILDSDSPSVTAVCCCDSIWSICRLPDIWEKKSSDCTYNDRPAKAFRYSAVRSGWLKGLVFLRITFECADCQVSHCRHFSPYHQLITAHLLFLIRRYSKAETLFTVYSHRHRNQSSSPIILVKQTSVWQNIY